MARMVLTCYAETNLFKIARKYFTLFMLGCGEKILYDSDSMGD